MFVFERKTSERLDLVAPAPEAPFVRTAAEAEAGKRVGNGFGVIGEDVQIDGRVRIRRALQHGADQPR